MAKRKRKPLSRSQMMSAIHSKNTTPELLVRRALFKLGFRYRLYRRDLPGSPDLVLTRYGVAIFINGCFWHQHGCKFTSRPKSNQNFWNSKFTNNIVRDMKVQHELLLQGFRVACVWECSVAGRGNMPTEQVIERLAAFIKGDEERIEI